MKKVVVWIKTVLTRDPTDTGDEGEQQKDAGSTAEQTAGPSGVPQEISAEEATASEAVDQFDQMEDRQGDVDSEDPATGQPDENAIPGTGISMIMMEQWLDRIEGDPAFLLRNQFLIEEQRQLEQRGGALMENRPW
jgi:Ca-activated chloride channel family protein